MVAGMTGGGYDGEVFGFREVMGFGKRAAGIVEVRWCDGGLREVAEAAGVIEVPMGEDDGFYLAGFDVYVGELAVDLLVAVEIEFVEDVVVAWGYVDADAGVDQEEAFRVVDYQDPDGFPFVGQAACDPAGGEEMEADRVAVGGQLN
jgi:hypothetical protein